MFPEMWSGHRRGKGILITHPLEHSLQGLFPLWAWVVITQVLATLLYHKASPV